MVIYPYQTREVRDLAWACFSPPLLLSAELGSTLDNCRFPLTVRRRAWLEQLDRDARPLLLHLSGMRSGRLGTYFEALWQFFLAQDPEVELLANNLPVMDGNRTVGEFDCLYFCRRRQRYVHLELAVKFYLASYHSPNGDGCSKWSDWLGPESRDRLDIKLSRLLRHQILLSDHPRGRDLLQQLGIEEPLREIEIKGYLFRPRARQAIPPRGFNPAQRLHAWLTVEELPAALGEIDAPGYLILARPLLLSPAKIDMLQEPLTADGLIDGLGSQADAAARPQLVAALDAAGSEITRFFVTAAGWPHPGQGLEPAPADGTPGTTR